MKQILALVLATICWGLWGFSSKLASDRSPSFAVLMAFSIPWTIAFPFLLWFSLSLSGMGTKTGIFWGIASGISALLGMLTFILALQWGASSFGVMMVSVYPLITLLLFAFMGIEKLTLYHGFGAILIVLGLLVMQFGE
jgi:drug/metabolite transporter (DMT)-like permease